MTIDEMEAACDVAEARGVTGREPELIVAVPGRAGKGERKTVAPGLLGVLLNERQLEGGGFECTVAVKTKDARRFIKRARYRAAFHGPEVTS